MRTDAEAVGANASSAARAHTTTAGRMSICTRNIEKGRCPRAAPARDPTKGIVSFCRIYCAGRTRMQSCDVPRGLAPRAVGHRTGMRTNDVTAERLRDLAALSPAAGKVLSLFLNLDPTEFATPPARSTEINSL